VIVGFWEVIQFMWVWGIIISAVMAALFLVIALAQLEAGAKTRFRWLMLAFCSLVIVTVLIINKPKANMEEIDYIPVPPVTENANEQKDTAAKINTSIPSLPSLSGFAGGEELQRVGQTENIQEKANGEFDEYQDPVLREIMALKRQAVEKQKVAVSGESSGMPSDKEFTDYGSHIQASEQIKRAKVMAPALNIRDKGSLDGRIVGSLSSGDIIEVIDQSDTGEWISVKLSSGQTGWVMKKYLQYYP